MPTRMGRLVGECIASVELGNHAYSGEVYLLLRLESGKVVEVTGWKDIGYGPFPPVEEA